MHRLSSYELDPAAVELLQNGWKRREAVERLFVYGVSVFVGNFLAALTWLASYENQTNNSAITGYASLVVLAVVVAVLLYRYLELEWAKRVVRFVAEYAASLLEILLVLLLTSLINQAWAFGSDDNVIANGVGMVLIAVASLLYTWVDEGRVRRQAIQAHLSHHANTLHESEAANVVDAWIERDERSRNIYPLLNNNSLPPTPFHHPLSISHTQKRRRRRKKKPLFSTS